MNAVHAAVMAALVSRINSAVLRGVKAPKRVHPAAYYATNQPREVARRKRQIERGIIKVTPWPR